MEKKHHHHAERARGRVGSREREREEARDKQKKRWRRLRQNGKYRQSVEAATIRKALSALNLNVGSLGEERWRKLLNGCLPLPATCCSLLLMVLPSMQQHHQQQRCVRLCCRINTLVCSFIFVSILCRFCCFWLNLVCSKKQHQLEIDAQQSSARRFGISPALKVRSE